MKAWRTPLAILAGAILPVEAHADIVLSIRAEVPRLALNTGGPVGMIRSLAFSPDSGRIYSAGLDKTVQVWAVRDEARGVQRVLANRAFLARTLRWEIARGLRGAIETIAVSPDAGRLAIGGYSARDIAGDIVVYNAATGEIERLLRSHQQTVIGLTYSPDGTKLASVALDGELVVWSAPDWQPRTLRTAQWKQRFPYPQPVTFLSNSILAAAAAVDAEARRWRVNLHDVSNPNAQPIPLDQAHTTGIIERAESAITALASDPKSERWASADRDGNIYLWVGAGSQIPRLLRKDRPATALAFGPGNRLFVATRIDALGQAVLEMWDAQRAKKLDQVEISTVESGIACAVSPDGSRVVCAAGDGDRIYVFLLKDRLGNLVDQPLSRAAPLELRGAGERIWKVAFAADAPHRVGFGRKLSSSAALRDARSFNNYGSVEEEFDLDAFQWRRPAAGAWRAPTEGAGEWRVTPDPDGLRLHLKRAEGADSIIKLDANVHGAARSYCWLADGAGRPAALAVGTFRQNGIFVFRATPLGDWPLVRYYRDHNEAVTSLSVSRDGRFLASASADQTIKIWSLEGLVAAKDPLEAAWGASVETRDGRVTVTTTNAAGIAARRGLRPGDVITHVRVAREGKPVDYREAEEIVTALRGTPIWQSVLLTVERRGHPLNRQILLVPAWEPLLTLFVSREGEWAAWTPQGYYDASVAGDALFGWQLNRGADRRPDFYRADQFRDQLERPGVLRRLLSAGNLRDALRQANEAIPSDFDSALVQSLRAAAKVTIESPRDGQELAGDTVGVVARVTFADYRTAESADVRAFVNGVPGATPKVVDNGLARTYQWRVSPPDFYNRVRVVVDPGPPPMPSSVADDVHFRQAVSAKRDRPRLHLLALAASDYPGELKLRFAVADAKSILDLLRAKGPDLFAPGFVYTLYDADANRNRVEETIGKLLSQLEGARSDDLLVVVVAGHGFAFDRQYFFVPPDPQLKSLTAAQQSEQNLRELLNRIGVAWEQIRRLSAAPCRKLVLLDTCFSGNVLLTQQPSSHWKAALRPLQHDEFLVMSATEVGQLAFESEEFRHGVFTQCLLEGFLGNADRGSASAAGVVDLEEIAHYVRQQVPIRTNHMQTPRASPADLFDLISLPLVRYR